MSAEAVLALREACGRVGGSLEDFVTAAVDRSGVEPLASSSRWEAHGARSAWVGVRTAAACGLLSRAVQRLGDGAMFEVHAWAAAAGTAEASLLSHLDASHPGAVARFVLSDLNGAAVARAMVRLASDADEIAFEPMPLRLPQAAAPLLGQLTRQQSALLTFAHSHPRLRDVPALRNAHDARGAVLWRFAIGRRLAVDLAPLQLYPFAEPWHPGRHRVVTVLGLADIVPEMARSAAAAVLALDQGYRAAGHRTFLLASQTADPTLVTYLVQHHSPLRRAWAVTAAAVADRVAHRLTRIPGFAARDPYLPRASMSRGLYERIYEDCFDAVEAVIRGGYQLVTLCEPRAIHRPRSLAASEPPRPS